MTISGAANKTISAFVNRTISAFINRTIIIHRQENMYVISRYANRNDIPTFFYYKPKFPCRFMAGYCI